jgi:hypothetical protein
MDVKTENAVPAESLRLVPGTMEMDFGGVTEHLYVVGRTDTNVAFAITGRVGAPDDGLSRALAHRFSALWNACTGISTKRLEALKPGELSALTELAELSAGLDESAQNIQNCPECFKAFAGAPDTTSIKPRTHRHQLLNMLKEIVAADDAAMEELRKMLVDLPPEAGELSRRAKALMTTVEAEIR